MDYADMLQAAIDDFAESVDKIQYEVYEKADEEQFHEFLKVLKLLDGCSVFKISNRAASSYYVKKFGV